jgi:outer membrane protein assembly factor BamB
VALIELELTAQPQPALSSPPPAYRYRLPGLLIAAVLLLALGGAAPPAALLWRHLGRVPAPGGSESPFQLTGGRGYTVAAGGAQRVATAWALDEPPRRLWTTSFPARVVGPDEVAFGGVGATQAGHVVLLSDGPATTVVDAATGKRRWGSPVQVTPLSGDRIGIEQYQTFRPGTVYDQDSGEPGLLYFSSTGEPHVEPPLSTEVRGVDLATGATVWSVPVAGSVNVFAVPGGVLVLASDRLERLAVDTGAITRTVMLPKIGGSGPDGGSIAGGMVVVGYGNSAFAGLEVAYTADTLQRRWQRDVPEVLLDPPNCGTVLCSGPRAALDVIDPATGRVAWRVPADVDLVDHGSSVLEVDTGSGAPVRLVDAATGRTRIDLAGWRAEIGGGPGEPIVLRRPEAAGSSAFGVVLAGRDRVQMLGESGGAVSDCAADRAHVVCRGAGGLQVWAYRS